MMVFMVPVFSVICEFPHFGQMTFRPIMIPFNASVLFMPFLRSVTFKSNIILDRMGQYGAMQNQKNSARIPTCYDMSTSFFDSFP